MSLRSPARQLRLATLLPLIFACCLFDFLYMYELTYTSEQKQRQTSEVYLTQLLPSVRFALLHHQPDLLEEILNTTTVSTDIDALSIYDASGKLLVHRGKPIQLPRKLPTIQRSLELHHHAFLTPIPQLGWIGIELDAHPKQILFYQHLLIVLLINFGMIILVLFIQARLSESILIPLARLRRSMKQILKNEFETEIKVSSQGILHDIESGCLHLQKKYLDNLHDQNYQIEVATADLQQSLELLEEKNIELTLDKKKTEEKMQQQAEFIANMSHEIRTPMNGILGFTNVLLDGNLNTLQQDYVNTIKLSAQNLLNIINDILDYSKIDAGKLHFEAIPIDLRHCIDEVITFTTAAANQKHLDLIAITESDLPQVIIGDPLRIKQILNNLLGNAVKFTEQGQIVLHSAIAKTTSTHYTFMFKISDSGIGISQDEIPRLFHAFNQADPTISRRFGGSGLGLVICKKLAEAMNGHISVNSEPLKGTTFTVHITVQKHPIYEQERDKIKPADQPVLCIEPNPLASLSLSHTLSYLHYTPIIIEHVSQIPDSLAKHPEIKLLLIATDTLLDPETLSIIHASKHPYILLSKKSLPKKTTKYPQAQLLKPISTQKLEDTIQLLLQPKTNNHNAPSKLQSLRDTLKGENLSILIAEDNPVNRLLFETLLSPHCQLNTVHDGKMALEQGVSKTYSLILLDLQMPKHSGQEVAEQLRQTNNPNTYTPILFISANATDIGDDMLAKLHIPKCLQKPIDEATLLQELLQALSPHKEPAIDFEACVKRMSGKVDLAQTFLDRFIEELEQNKINFKQLIQHEDLNGLAMAAHTLKGACGFAAAPVLSTICTELETRATNHESINSMMPLLHRLFVEIERVLRTHFRKIRT